MIIETSIIISRNKKTKVIILRERGSESKTKYINITLLERLTWFQNTPKTFATVGQNQLFCFRNEAKKAGHLDHPLQSYGQNGGYMVSDIL